MHEKKRREVERFVQNQKAQLGLNEEEAQELMQQSIQEFDQPETLMAAPNAASAGIAPTSGARKMTRPKRSQKMSDPYLPQSQTIRARPTRVSKLRSLLYDMALPNEFIMPIGVKGARPVLGGKFFKLGKRFLKFPAAVQTVYFTSDNANKNYQGLKIDGYACWRVDPEKPEITAANLDFSDHENPMGNTNRILRTICTEAIRHIIANITIEDSLTKKDEIGRDLKAQLERVERSWGILFDQVGIERVTILSGSVFDDLQQKTRDDLRLTAAQSRMETDRKIEITQSRHQQELEQMRDKVEKESRLHKATSETEVQKVELEELSKRQADERATEEARQMAERESTERAAEHEATQAARQAERAAELQINAAESALKITQTQYRNEQIKAEAEHKKLLKGLALEMERKNAEFEANQRLTTEELNAEILMARQRFEQKIAERKQGDELQHEIDLRKIDRLRLEEEIRNSLSQHRVLETLVQGLPDIAASMKIDRYTVTDSSGGSPLTHTLNQVISLLDENNLLGLLRKGTAAKTE